VRPAGLSMSRMVDHTPLSREGGRWFHDRRITFWDARSPGYRRNRGEVHGEAG
jgi:hypothetical protein